MKVEDVMTIDIVTARTETPLKAVAQQLVERRISGLPVVNDGGEVVGVISEADLLVKEGGTTPRRPGLLAKLDVGVAGGEVSLGGNVRRRSTAEALPQMVEKTPGVVGVVSELTWVEDDSKPKRVPVRERGRYPL